MLAEHERIRRHTNRLRRHDLVAKRIIDYAVLVNPSLMRESVATDDCFIRLHVEADDARKQLARRVKLLRLDTRFERQTIGAYVQRHHDLFERRVARALTDAIDRALDLPRARFNRRESVRHREAEIVMTVNTDSHVSISYDSFAHLLDQARVLIRRRVAHRVGNIEY